jgi:hypothetical protein
VLVSPAARLAERLRDQLSAARVECQVIGGPEELDGLSLSASTDVLVLPSLENGASVPGGTEP